MGNGRRWVWLVAGLAVGLAALAHLAWGGPVRLSFGEVLGELARGDVGGGEVSNVIVWRIRLPRVLAAVAVGAVLAYVGSAFQVLFRNALAEPYVVGVSSGAGAAGVLALVGGLSGMLGGLGLPLAGAAGGLAALGVVLLLAGWGRGLDVVRLLLSGVVVGAALAALTTLILLLGGRDSNQVLRWLLGSLTPMDWGRAGSVWGALVLAVLAVGPVGRRLNAFAFDDDLARRLGVDPRRVAGRVLLGGTVATGLVVGSVGIIGFLGLVGPHIARRLVGGDFRLAGPLSALVGSLLILVADLGAQRLVSGVELPVGSVTAVLGAPVLIVLLRRGVAVSG